MAGALVAKGRPEEIERSRIRSRAIPPGRTEDCRAAPAPRSKEKRFASSAAKQQPQGCGSRIALGLLTVVTAFPARGIHIGDDILYRALAQSLYRSMERPAHSARSKAPEIDKVIEIDQAPSAARRDRIPEYTASRADPQLSPCCPSHASAATTRPLQFQVKGGRCEACQGAAWRRIEMNFRPDVYVTCEVCRARRYNSETLSVRYKGHSISDLLGHVEIADGLKFWNIPSNPREARNACGRRPRATSSWANPPPRFPAGRRSASNSLKSFPNARPAAPSTFG